MATQMRAMIFEGREQALRLSYRPLPSAGPGQVLIKVLACGVCRTDLHIIKSELSDPKLPLVPGHEIVGKVAEVGPSVDGLSVGDRVGVPWLGSTCGACLYCSRGQENLCELAEFTGYTIDGGYAEYVVARADFCFPIPSGYDDVEAAPLLCAGLIGFRSYRMAGEAFRLGLYGFGAAAHLLCQLAAHEGRRVYAFTRPGDLEGQAFARDLGAHWAGDSSQRPAEDLDAAIIFAPAGFLIPLALRAVAKRGKVICGGIHMSDIPPFPYSLLWGERSVQSVCNLTRDDGREFFRLIEGARLAVATTEFPLEEANEALSRLESGSIRGAAVLNLKA